MSFSTLGSLVARQIVHDDDVAFRERGSEAFLHPFLERGGVDRSVEGLLRHEAGKAQASDERDGFVMAMGNADAQPSTAPASSAFARHIGGGPGFVDEHELPRIEVELPQTKPGAASERPGAAVPRHARSSMEWPAPPSGVVGSPAVQEEERQWISLCLASISARTCAA